jgi:predicted small secreted protein
MKKTIHVAGIMLVLALAISACLPTAAGQPEQQGQQVQNTPTLDTQSQINTAVAQTIEAQGQIATAVALTTAAQYTATPSATPFTIPTLTPFVVLTPTTKPSGGGGAPAKAAYACDIIRLRPTAYTEINRGQEFDIKMTVVNKGTRAWYQGYDLKYAGGPKMTSVLHIELPALGPGEMHEVILDANAPTERGNQTMTWTVEGRLCFGYVTITVK